MKPLINDITTTPENPPRFRKIVELPENRTRDLGYPESFIEIQRKAYPQVRPLVTPWPPDEAFRKVSALARKMPRWKIVLEDPVARVLEAVATTAFFRFKDDIVIEVRAEPGGSSVHMRSKSRLGKGDLGANAERIQAFLGFLSE